MSVASTEIQAAPSQIKSDLQQVTRYVGSVSQSDSDKRVKSMFSLGSGLIFLPFMIFLGTEISGLDLSRDISDW